MSLNLCVHEREQKVEYFPIQSSTSAKLSNSSNEISKEKSRDQRRSEIHNRREQFFVFPLLSAYFLHRLIILVFFSSVVVVCVRAKQFVQLASSKTNPRNGATQSPNSKNCVSCRWHVDPKIESNREFGQPDSSKFFGGSK